MWFLPIFYHHTTMKAETADNEREEKEENHNRPVVIISILLLFGPQVISRMHCKHKRCSIFLQPGNLGVQHLPLKETSGQQIWMFGQCSNVQRNICERRMSQISTVDIQSTRFKHTHIARLLNFTTDPIAGYLKSNFTISTWFYTARCDHQESIQLQILWF